MLNDVTESMRDRTSVSAAVKEIARVQTGLIIVIALGAIGVWTGSFDAEGASPAMLLSALGCLFLLGLGFGLEGVHVALQPRHHDPLTSSMRISACIALIVTGVGCMLMTGATVVVLLSILVKGDAA